MAVKHITLPSNITVDINDSRISGVDTTVTSESTNVITSGAVYSAIEDNQAVAVYTINVSDFPDIEESNYTISTEMFAAMKADYHDRNIYPILRFAMESNKDQPSEGANYVDYFCTGVYESNPTYWSFLFISPSSSAWGGTGSSSAISVSWNGSAVSCIYRYQPLQQADYRVTSWQAHPSHSYYPSEKLVKDSLDAKQGTLVSGTNIKTINNQSLLGSGNITISGGGGDALPTPNNAGLFLESYWDVASSSHKWKISENISNGSPGTLYVDTDYGIRASQFATSSGPKGSGSQILINSSGLIGEAWSSNTVFSDWSWIKYRNSYNPQHYVTLQQTLNELPLLPAVTSSDFGHMLYVGYDQEYGYYWSKNSPFYFGSLQMIGDPYWGIILQNSLDEQLRLSHEGLYYYMDTDRSAEFKNWNWITYNYYDSTAGTRFEVGLQDTLDTKQATLVSGTNIKTINNQSLLGSGNITISGGDTSTCVHKTGDETIGGDKTFTDNIGVVDADHIVYSGGGGGGGFTREYTYTTDSGNYIDFYLEGEPKAFVVSIHNNITDYSNNTVIGVVGDSTGIHGVYTTGTQHNYSSGFTKSYSNGVLRLTAPSGVTFADTDWAIVYYYGNGTLTFKTSQVQPGSGATTATFTGASLTEVPAFYAILLESQVNNESYRRVAYYTNEGDGWNSAKSPLGISFFSSQIHNTTSSFSVSYNNGLYINSGGTNAGGYFHNPGTYTLYYLMASDVAGGGFQSLGDELDDIRDTIGDIATILASI